MQIPKKQKYIEILGKLKYSLCFCVFWVWGNLHIKNRHIISGKHAQELYADFYMLPKASDSMNNIRPRARPRARMNNFRYEQYRMSIELSDPALAAPTEDVGPGRI